MSMAIHPFGPIHYEAITRVMNRAVPRNPVTAARIKDWDIHRPGHLKAERWVTDIDGVVVAVGDYSQSSDMYHPQKFQVSITVDPDYQHRGIGSALYDFLTAQLEQHEPIAYQARAYADQEDTLRFLQTRDFVEDFRMWESELDVSSFQAEAYGDVDERLQARGFEIVPLTDLADDPRRDRLVFELERETMQDIPSPESVTSTREQLKPEEVEERMARYVERVINHPDRPLDAYFVARHGNEYVGLTYFELDREHLRADILMTGVKRDYRGLGIGTALKVRGVLWAREHGYKTIVTGNDTVNRPILAINDRMGFVRQPEMIFFEKRLPAG